MPECSDCIALNDSPVQRSPHANLLLHSEANINFGGTAAGRVEYYLCNRCGTQWEREVARSEPQAQWRHASKPLA